MIAFINFMVAAVFPHYSFRGFIEILSGILLGLKLLWVVVYVSFMVTAVFSY